MNKGFTLAEILVAMAIITILGMIIVVIFSNTLRGSNKSQLLAVIKQNGQAVLEKMDKIIRASDNVICPKAVNTPSNTLVVEQKGVYTRFLLNLQTSGANGWIKQDNPIPPSGDIGSFLNTVCDDPPDPNATLLTDTNTKTGVSVVGGSFIRDRQSGFKDKVTVEFSLSPGVAAPQVIAGQIDPVKFQTTVVLR